MHTLKLTEEQRQLTLMSLAHLAVERPGWRAALWEIASTIDNPPPDSMFERFYELSASELQRALRGRLDV